MVNYQSLKADSDAATRSLQLAVHVSELTRQALLFNTLFARAWQRAIDPAYHPGDPAVWGDIQGALFAAIIIERTFKPGKNPLPFNDRTPAESKSIVKTRGEALQALFGLADGSVILTVGAVRNAFEHVDERLDAIIDSGAPSISDWHITHGEMAAMPPKEIERSCARMRVFEPLCGRLHYGEICVEMFDLDCALINLRQRAETSVAAELHKMREGSRTNHFDGLCLGRRDVSFALTQADNWLKQRSALGAALPFTVDVKAQTITAPD